MSNNVNTLAKQYPRIKKEQMEWFKRVVDYNLHQGKFFANAFLFAYMGCEQPERLTEENIELAKICGISVEMVSYKNKHYITTT